MAERNVQTLKRKLEAMSTERGTFHSKVNEILQRYRATPLLCGKSPAELYFNRRIRIKLDTILPTTKFQKTKPIPGVRKLSVGERVSVLHMQNNKNIWKTGSILEKYGQLHYLVKLDDGYIIKRHIDQLKSSRIKEKQVRFDSTVQNKPSPQPNNAYQYYVLPSAFQNQFQSTIPETSNSTIQSSQENQHIIQNYHPAQQYNNPDMSTSTVPDSNIVNSNPEQDITPDIQTSTTQPSPAPQQQTVRRSQRQRAKPAYLRYYVDEID